MKQEILTPSYYHEFKCFGSACEDTCCVGWKVTVGFNKYRKITSEPFAEQELWEITMDNQDRFNYVKSIASLEKTIYAIHTKLTHAM